MLHGRGASTLSTLRASTSAARGCKSVVLWHARPRHLVIPHASSDDKSTAAPSTETLPTSSPPAPAATSSSQVALAAGAVALGAGLYVASRLLTGGPSLAAMEQDAVPLEAALANGKPTVIEFYANWCEVCKELVPVAYQVEEQYKGDVNFVMLNVANNKWAPEMDEFGVNGIPHFVFLDRSAQPLTAAVGRLPQQVLEGNISALAAGKPLPYTTARGRTSSLTPPEGAEPVKQANPRDHA